MIHHDDPPEGSNATRLRQAPTADLLTELMARYDEAIFIGCKPRGALRINDKQANGQASEQDNPYVDINSKLDKTTGIGGTLATILARILDSLRTKARQSQAY